MQVKTAFILLLMSGCCNQTYALSTDRIQSLVNSPLGALFNTPIQTASQYPEYLGSTPANILVIEREQIQERRYRHLLDLLQDQPSVDIAKYTDPTNLHNLSLRGLSNSRNYLILQDGMRITTPDGDNLAISDNFPLYHLDRVEILYGPAAAIYGADAFTGVINLISDVSHKTKLNLGTGQGIGEQYRYAFGQTEFNHDWQLSLGAHTQRTDLSKQLREEFPEYYTLGDALDFAGNTVVPVAERAPFRLLQKSSSAFARLDYDDSLSVNFFHSRLEHGTNVGDLTQSTLYDHDAVWANQLDSISLSYKASVNEVFNTETNLQYLEHELRNQSQFKNIYTNFARGYKYAKGKQWLFSQRFDYQWRDTQRLVGGVSYEYTDALPRTTDLPTPYDPNRDAQNQLLFYDNTDIPIKIGQISYNNIGAYLQLHSTWSQKFSTIAGLRFDKNSRYGSSINPRLGLIYQAGERTLIKLLYGEAFRAPSANETLRQFGSFSGERNANGDYVSSFFATPNYDLIPETLQSLEFNIYHVFSKEFNAQFSVYYNQIEDLINTRNDSNPLQFIPNAQILRGSIKDNLDSAKTYGADVLLNYQTRLNERWKIKLWGNYSYIDGGIDSKNAGVLADLPYTSQHKLKLGATLNYGKNYFITPKLYLISAMNTPQLAANSDSNRLQSPGFALMNLHIGAKNIFDNKGLHFYVDIENLWDSRYYNAGGGAAASSIVKVPQIGRRILFNLEWQY